MISFPLLHTDLQGRTRVHWFCNSYAMLTTLMVWYFNFCTKGKQRMTISGAAHLTLGTIAVAFRLTVYRQSGRLRPGSSLKGEYISQVLCCMKIRALRKRGCSGNTRSSVPTITAHDCDICSVRLANRASSQTGRPICEPYVTIVTVRLQQAISGCVMQLQEELR